MQSTKTKNLQEALNVIQIEQEALKDLICDLENNQAESFEKAINILFNCTGRIVVTGIGKSGHIGNKIAATLASTGSPSFFVHPTELAHGDFGMLKSNDVMLALSFSGETEELKKILFPIKRNGIKLISISGNEDSTIAQNSDVPLFAKIQKEACPFNLAPTSSTAVALALGDAIAITLMKLKEFTTEDFAKSHPGGSLGKKLIKIIDVMRIKNDIPLVKEDSSFSQIIEEINNKAIGFTTVVDQSNNLIGIVTDGDIRRANLKFKENVFKVTAKEIMTKDPKTIEQNDLAVSALKIMEDFKISDLVVINQDKNPIGIVHLKDFLKAGIL